MKKMKRIIEEELYLKIGSLLDDYYDLLEHLEGYRTNNLEDDWSTLEEVLDEYDSLPIYEGESATEKEDERREPAVNDRVRVTDWTECYGTYSSWVEKYISEPSEKYLWDYGRACHDGDEGKVIFIAPHEYGSMETLAYVKMNNGKCYLIGIKGIEKI